MYHSKTKPHKSKFHALLYKQTGISGISQLDFVDRKLITVEPVYLRHLGTTQQCPDHSGVQIFQVSLYNKESFGTTTKCVDYAGVLIFKCPD